jgi:hypothetical protein
MSCRCVALHYLASAALLAAACASAPADGAAPPEAEVADRAADPPPAARTAAGAGTLRQDDVTVSLRAGPLLLKVTPLDESIIRLLAPDTYQRLRALADAHMPMAVEVATSPALFLVSFFSHEPDVPFRSEDVQLEQMGRRLRPLSVTAITAGFGTQRLRAQETQLAAYVFDHPLDYDQPIVVRYGSLQSDAWSQIIPRLDLERARLRTRGG